MEQYIKDNFELDFVQNLNPDGFKIKTQTYMGEIGEKEYEVKFLYVDDILTGVILNDKKLSVKKFEKKMNKILSKTL